MGIRDWFARKPTGLTEVRAPSPEYATPIDAIRALLGAMTDDGSWLTFEASASGRSAVLQVAGDQINFCNEEMDLPGILASAALGSLAQRVTPAGSKQADKTLWTLAEPTPQDMAAVVDAAFARGFGLGSAYEVQGRREDGGHITRLKTPRGRSDDDPKRATNLSRWRDRSLQCPLPA